MLPRFAISNKAPLLLVDYKYEQLSPCFLASLNTLVFDFMALVSSSWTLETSQYKKFNKASEFEASPPKLTLFQEYRGLQQELF